MDAKKKFSKTVRSNGGKIIHGDELPLSHLFAVKSKKSLKTPQRKASKKVKHPVHENNSQMNVDETPEAMELQSTVHQRVEDFIKSGRFCISSDEEDNEAVKENTKYINKSSSKSSFLAGNCDDSDSEMHSESVSAHKMYTAKPIVTAGTSTNIIEIVDDDIMSFVDSVLAGTSSNTIESPSDEFKILEDYRKETEEMLKSASSLLHQIRTGNKTEPDLKVETPGASEDTLRVCPICLESLSERPTSVTVCGHIFCRDCILETAKKIKKCPTCRKAINSKKIHPVFL